MARRNDVKNRPDTLDETEIPNDNLNSEDTDTMTVTDETQAPEDTGAVEPTEPTEAAAPADGGENAAPAEAEKPIDLEPFKAAVQEAVGQADPNLGFVPESAIELVNVQYRALDGQKAKAMARTWLQGLVADTMMSGNAEDIFKAKSYWVLGDKLSAGGAKAEKAEREPEDPTVAAVQRVGVLRLALQNVVIPALPEGTDLETQVNDFVAKYNDEVTRYLGWATSTAEDKGDEPAVSPISRKAARLAMGQGMSGRGSSGTVKTDGKPVYSGPSRSVLKHIAEAFAGKEAGAFMSINDIVKFKSTEYGDDNPSSGAVSARFYPTAEGKVWESKNTPGFEPATGPDGKTRGIRKVATEAAA